MATPRIMLTIAVILSIRWAWILCLRGSHHLGKTLISVLGLSFHFLLYTVAAPTYSLITERPKSILRSSMQIKGYEKLVKVGLFSSDVLYTLQQFGNRYLRLTDCKPGLVFVGIFCTAKDAATRNVLRQTNVQLARAMGGEVVAAKFVICQPNVYSELHPWLWAEMHAHDDIVLVDCVENMDEGKSFEYFTTIRKLFPHYQYYAKADTDSYILYHNLALGLRNAPRLRLYGGRQNPGYLSGSLYFLSTDLLELLEDCKTQSLSICHPDKLQGAEDKIMGFLLKNLVLYYSQEEHITTEKNALLNYAILGPEHSLLYDRDPRDQPERIHPWNVLIHDVKGPEEWWNLHVQYTNLTTVESLQAAMAHTFFPINHVN